jgi:hypothetical protein
MDKAITPPDKRTGKMVQLKFSTRTGFVSPSGNPLQVVYLNSQAKQGLSITYVDAKAKQFWAQAPGVSGLARGPFKLPAGVGAVVAKITAGDKKALAAQVSHRPQGNGAVTTYDGSGGRRRSGGSGGRIYFGGGGSGGGGQIYFGGGSGGGGYGGGGGGGWGS